MSFRDIKKRLSFLEAYITPNRCIIPSTRITVTHEKTATLNSPPFFHAAISPTKKAHMPEIGDLVAAIIAGKVIAARVTYGT